MRKEAGRQPREATRKDGRRRSAFRLLACGFCFLLPGEVIDRIAISVGNQVITESQIDEEIRLTAFLNHEKLDLSGEERKKAAARLIEQALIKRDMDLSRYPLPAQSEADASLHDVQASYPSPAAFQAALQQYGITEAGLRQRLLWQLTLLRFIDYRFRPGIQIRDTEVQAYYDQELAKWKQQGIQPVPALDDARGKIEEILTQQQIDQALNQWLSAARRQSPINYLDEALK